MKSSDNKSARYKGNIEIELDRTLAKSEKIVSEGRKDYPGIMIVGPSGIGKTPRILQWAEDEGVNMFHVRCPLLQEVDFYGMMWRNEDGSEVQLASSYFDNFGKLPRSVLFLDDYDKAPASVQDALFTLIDEHTVPDCTLPGGKRFIDFLFTVAAGNEYVPMSREELYQSESSSNEDEANEADKKAKAEYDEFLKEILSTGNWVVCKYDEEYE